MPQQYIDFAFVKQRANFEAVLSHYELKAEGTGIERSVLCPFHTETKPSCKIELERKIFQCFGCTAKGNVLEFVALMEGNRADLRGAALRLAAICKIPLAPPPGSARKQTAGLPPGRKGPETPAEPVRAPSEVHASDEGPINPPLAFALKLDPDHPYLAERGVSAELVAEFGLGHCTRGSMAGRICIPIHNEHGELVAYAGRWPGDEGFPEGEDRYKLPAKFQKSRVLFNLHRVAAGAHIVLVEGYWSTIRLHALHVPVAGLMGWSVSLEQIALLLARGITRVTLLLDGDETGRLGRERVLPVLCSSFFVRAPLLPAGEKPDTLPEQQLRELVNLN
jgi:DNA primase